MENHTQGLRNTTGSAPDRLLTLQQSHARRDIKQSSCLDILLSSCTALEHEHFAQLHPALLDWSSSQRESTHYFLIIIQDIQPFGKEKQIMAATTLQRGVSQLLVNKAIDNKRERRLAIPGKKTAVTTLAHKTHDSRPSLVDIGNKKTSRIPVGAAKKSNDDRNPRNSNQHKHPHHQRAPTAVTTAMGTLRRQAKVSWLSFDAAILACMVEFKL